MLVLDDLIHIYAVLGIFLIIVLFVLMVSYIAWFLIKLDNDTKKQEKNRIKNIIKEINENEEK